MNEEVTSNGHLNCPFCGDRDIRAHHRGHPTAGEWVIECHSCSCELTGFASESDAWVRWNARKGHETKSNAAPGEIIRPQNPAMLDGGTQSSRELAPCWCPYCGEPHGPRVKVEDCSGCRNGFPIEPRSGFHERIIDGQRCGFEACTAQKASAQPTTGDSIECNDEPHDYP